MQVLISLLLYYSDINESKNVKQLLMTGVVSCYDWQGPVVNQLS